MSSLFLKVKVKLDLLYLFLSGVITRFSYLKCDKSSGPEYSRTAKVEAKKVRSLRNVKLPAELIHQSLSGDVFDDVLVVVVPHGT